MNGEELIFSLFSFFFFSQVFFCCFFFFLPMQISADVNQLSVLEIHEASRGSPQLPQLPRGCLGN